MTTFTQARKECRALGYTLRKETPGSDDLALYPLGTGIDAPSAYFTTCPVDALETCRAMARVDLEQEAAKLLDDPTSPENRDTIESVAAEMGLPPRGPLAELVEESERMKRHAPRPARVQTKAELRAMAARPDIMGELAREGLRAVSCDSGAFPLYAFRDAQEVTPDDLDAMAYGPAFAGLV